MPEQIENHMVNNPFMQDPMNTNMYFNQLFNNISNKMYCTSNNPLLYPTFQNNMRPDIASNNNNLPDLSDINKMKKNKNIHEDSFNNQDNFSLNQQKNLYKNTYMKKINSLFHQNSADPMKLLQE